MRSTTEADATGDVAAKATVRRIRPTDTARMRALRLEMLADSPLAFLETLAEAAARPHPEFAARVAEAADGARIGQFVAEAEGRLVGHLGGMVAHDDPTTTVLFAVYITPSWRGRGLLGDLVEAAAAWSREVGRSRLMLEVASGNGRALRAYRRLGFAVFGTPVAHPKIPGLTEVWMRRPA
ncbi:MAG TPA: GNAT family N-acetyltransferase [Micromonosporaceae bacterium]